MYYMTIDPGSGGTGWAAWEESKWGECVRPRQTGVLTATVGDWDRRADRLSLEFANQLDWWAPKIVYIELPKLMAGSASGAASASSGDLFKLTILVGRYVECCHRAALCKSVLLPVNDWKGTMSKEAVGNRVYARLGKDVVYPNHSLDAVGMGLYLKGFMNATGESREKT